MDFLGLDTSIIALDKVAYEILELDVEPGQPPPPKIDAHWGQKFRERHPLLFKIKQQSLAMERKMSHDPKAIEKFFEQIAYFNRTFYIQPGDIWNLDETGFRVSIGGSQWIVTFSPQATKYLASGEDRESITSVNAISATSNVIPPILLVAGKSVLHKWVCDKDGKSSIPNGYCIGFTEHGIMTLERMLNYMVHFNRFTAKQ
jgi:hypothetical protein